MSNKTSAHTRYYLKSGQRVPSVTTALSILHKPALLHWAWEQGLSGKDYRKVRDQFAEIGTLAHYLIMCHLKNITPDTSEYSANDIQAAQRCLEKYWQWEKEHPMTPVMIEQPMVSEKYRFGGTIDCLCNIQGSLVLVDYKTSKAIYDDHFCQLAAYVQLLNENGYSVSNARILRIGRNPGEGFEERLMGNFAQQWLIFSHCLTIYNLKNKQDEIRVPDWF